MKVVVTGANRGIGLEFVKQLLARGDTVVAGARAPGEARELQRLAGSPASRLTVGPLDIGDAASVRRFSASLGDRPVDVLINNAGVLGKMQSLEELDLDDVMATYRINAVGAVDVTRALLPLLRKSDVRKVLHVSTGMASISDNTSGGAFAYRMSKAALNIASKSISVNLRGERIISVVCNPGWVQTDMGGAGAKTPVSESVSGMLKVLDGLTLDQSGSFLDFRGGTLGW